MPPAQTELARRLDDALLETPLVGIVRLDSERAALRATDAIVAGGVSVAEVALTTPGALDVIRSRRAAHEGVLLGAGSVRTEADAAAAMDAGSAFLVTPTFHPAVLRAATERGVPVICGAYTPTELDSARQAGAAYLKLFPATALGPSYIRDVRAPMPDLRIVPTGGVTLENLDEWFGAGSVAVAIGSALVSQALADTGAWAEMSRRAERFVSAARRASGAVQ
jgi:2-dehydro-3-deoxyphosphogluconate aldolase/(4S)-4-hydroxy-2-oxoglutarate aldolase